MPVRPLSSRSNPPKMLDDLERRSGFFITRDRSREEERALNAALYPVFFSQQETRKVVQMPSSITVNNYRGISTSKQVCKINAGDN